MSGAIAALGVVAASVVLTAELVPIAAALPARAALEGAADASALAAADAATGVQPGDPCALAEHIASANGAVLAGCRVDGFVVTVRVQRPLLGLPLAASATAGPPGTGT